MEGEQFKRFICMPGRSFLILQPAALIIVVAVVVVTVSVVAPGAWRRKLRTSRVLKRFK